MAETAIKTVAPAVELVTEPEVQLLMVPVKEVTESGKLISIVGFTDEENARVRAIVEGHDIHSTSANQMFASEPQMNISKFLDTLIADIKVKDADVAGELAAEMASGIDLLQLEKVKGQIKNPPSNAWIMRLIRKIFGIKNYLHAFYLSQQSIKTLTDGMKKKAKNRMRTLQGKNDKLDQLVATLEDAIEELRIYLAAAEAILLREIEIYQRDRQAALKSKDPLELSKLREHGRKIAQFETRVLRIKIAYVRAGNVSIPRARSFQEAIVIETDNLNEEVLSGIPRFKEAVLVVATLKEIQDAQTSREKSEANRAKLDNIIDDVGAEAIAKAKQSQGNPLDEVMRLEQTINAVVGVLQRNVELEAKTRSERAEAAEKLIELSGLVAEAQKAADIDAAEATAG